MGKRTSDWDLNDWKWVMTTLVVGRKGHGWAPAVNGELVMGYVSFFFQISVILKF